MKDNGAKGSRDFHRSKGLDGVARAESDGSDLLSVNFEVWYDAL